MSPGLESRLAQGRLASPLSLHAPGRREWSAALRSHSRPATEMRHVGKGPPDVDTHAVARTRAIGAHVLPSHPSILFTPYDADSTA